MTKFNPIVILMIIFATSIIAGNLSFTLKEIEVVHTHDHSHSNTEDTDTHSHEQHSHTLTVLTTNAAILNSKPIIVNVPLIKSFGQISFKKYTDSSKTNSIFRPPIKS